MLNILIALLWPWTKFELAGGEIVWSLANLVPSLLPLSEDEPKRPGDIDWSVSRVRLEDLRNGIFPDPSDCNARHTWRRGEPIASN